MTGNAKYRITDSHAAKRLGMTGNAKYRITDSHAAERLGMTGNVVFARAKPVAIRVFQ